MRGPRDHRGDRLARDDRPFLDSWLYYINQVERHVFIVTYGCQLQPGQETLDPVVSHEHGRVGLFTLDEVADLTMPQGYKDSITTWFTLLAGADAGGRAAAAVDVDVERPGRRGRAARW